MTTFLSGLTSSIYSKNTASSSSSSSCAVADTTNIAQPAAPNSENPLTQSLYIEVDYPSNPTSMQIVGETLYTKDTEQVFNDPKNIGSLLKQLCQKIDTMQASIDGQQIAIGILQAQVINLTSQTTCDHLRVLFCPSYVAVIRDRGLPLLRV